VACKATGGGGELQCGGLRPLYEVLERSGSSVEEGTACRSAFWFVFGDYGVDGNHYWITGDRVGYPRFSGFFSKEKNFGEPFSVWQKQLSIVIIQKYCLRRG